MIGIFLPRMTDERKKLEEKSVRLAYYTTADTAIEILTKRKLWMRNLRVMNDASEVDHGIEQLVSAFRTLRNEAGGDFKAVIDDLHVGLFEEIDRRFSREYVDWRLSTFVTCFSKHTKDDDDYGRLSMWRAYGGRTGVALIIKNDPFIAKGTNLGVYSAPVHYGHAAEAEQELRDLRDRIRSERDFLKDQPREVIANLMAITLRFTVVTMKHPAFVEEAEWRMIHCPRIDSTDFLRPVVRSVGGVPQHVVEFPLENSELWKELKLAPSDLIDRVLIGPCDHVDVVFDSLVAALTEAGVESPESKITLTGIPLRHSR